MGFERAGQLPGLDLYLVELVSAGNTRRCIMIRLVNCPFTKMANTWSSSLIKRVKLTIRILSLIGPVLKKLQFVRFVHTRNSCGYYCYLVNIYPNKSGDLSGS
jgi:hypothetical protein